MQKAYIPIIFIGTLVIFLNFPRQVNAETVTIESNKYCDTSYQVFDEWDNNPQIVERNPDSCPNDDALWIDTWDESPAMHPYTIARPLIQFDTSSIPFGATITQAQVKVYYHAESAWNLFAEDSATVKLHRLSDQYKSNITGSDIVNVTSTSLASLNYDLNMATGWYSLNIDSNYLNEINSPGHTYITYALAHNQDFLSSPPLGANTITFVTTAWFEYPVEGAIFDQADELWHIETKPILQIEYTQ